VHRLRQRQSLSECRNGVSDSTAGRALARLLSCPVQTIAGPRQRLRLIPTGLVDAERTRRADLVHPSATESPVMKACLFAVAFVLAIASTSFAKSIRIFVFVAPTNAPSTFLGGFASRTLADSAVDMRNATGSLRYITNTGKRDEAAIVVQVTSREEVQGEFRVHAHATFTDGQTADLTGTSSHQWKQGARDIAEQLAYWVGHTTTGSDPVPFGTAKSSSRSYTDAIKRAPIQSSQASTGTGGMKVKTLNIATVWNRIGTHAGEDFTMVRGAPFTYVVAHGAVRPSRTNRQISRADFEKALARVPLNSTAIVQDLQGPSFVYAILMDERISAGEW
jgi:hypothetical protein